MAILGVRSEVKVGYSYDLECSLINHVSNGTVSGESNHITAGAATAKLGKALDAAGDATKERGITVATMTRQQAAAP